MEKGDRRFAMVDEVYMVIKQLLIDQRSAAFFLSGLVNY